MSCQDQFEINQLLRQAMTVEELIDILQDCYPGTKVIFKCDYGDISHTQQALAVSSVELLAESGFTLRESGYSNSRVAVEECDDDEEPGVDEYDVIILS